MPNHQKRHILVVEDEMLLLDLFIAKLEARGWLPVGARSVDEATAFINELDTIHAVWLDHFLPGREGHEFLKFLKNDSRFKKIPVFLVTNAIESEVINQYVHLGIAGFYPKMLTPLEKIVDGIDLYLQSAEQPAE